MGSEAAGVVRAGILRVPSVPEDGGLGRKLENWRGETRLLSSPEDRH